MKEMSYNPYIEFYGENEVSPVKQDISDFRIHMIRREQLYRTIGVPIITFAGKDVLEVGPGGGYNTLCFFEWGGKVDLVEPNPTAQKEISNLFSQRKIKQSKWNLDTNRVENYESNKLYDIIIAEGFLEGINNQREVIAKLSSLVKKGGVVVVTCDDEISFFFNAYVRRILGNLLIQRKNIDSFEEKVKILSNAFKTHLDNLKYASRPIEDWVIDNLLNPAAYSEQISIDECLECFGEDFEFLGSSPNYFTNSNWYKNYEYKHNDEINKQFAAKRHLLIMSGMEEILNDPKNNLRLLEKCKEFKAFMKDTNNGLSSDDICHAIEILENIKNITSNLDYRLSLAIEESINLLKDPDINEYKIANSNNLAKIFGKMMYVSLMKKFTV